MLCTLAPARPAHALGFGMLPEGEVLEGGVRSRDDGFLHGKVDLAILPFPGGPDIWAGPIDASRVEALVSIDRKTTRVRAEEIRLALIRWPHIRALSLERNERLGSPIAAELAGAELPIPLEGTSNGRNYGVGFAGLGVGYRMLHDDAYGTTRAHGLSFTLTMRVETLQEITPRLDFRGLFGVSYTGLGAWDVHREHARYLSALLVDGEVLLTYDLGGAPYRVSRVTDVEGHEHEIARPARGKRLRLILADVGYELHPIDALGTFGNVAYAKVGLSHEF